MPARLIGAHLLARITETAVRFHYLGVEVARYVWTHTLQARIDYHHLIDSLVRKPGAFARHL
ncbi:MAG: hypothetical protein H7343_04320 [Undibacterium sp.]|nr:hypothetical protein [Opitutaceae bacterium]